MTRQNNIKAKPLGLAARASTGIARVMGLMPSLADRFGLAAANRVDLGESIGVALWSNRLLVLGKRAQTVLSEGGDDPRGDAAATLAKATKALGVSRAALFLPAEEFIATVIPLPGLTGAGALQALRLQASSLIPSLDEPLVLVQTPNRLAGTDDYFCLWMTQARLTELSEAFEVEGIELAAILPRALLAPSDDTGETYRLLDQDPQQITQVVMREGAPVKWDTLQRSDLDEPELLEQWQAELKSTELAFQGPLISQSDPAWLSTQEAMASLNAALATGIYFVPPGEVKRRQAQKNKTTITAIAASLALIAVLTLIPFALQSIQFRLAANELADLRALNSTARQDQAYVADFDSRWGTINDYPRQEIIDALYTLQRVISPDTLTGLEIEEGVVNIEGTSNNPQAILQRLEQDQLFTEVAFSRATSNSRYSISLRLSNVSFEGYRARYAEVSRR
jgi:hypothetical protein